MMMTLCFDMRLKCDPLVDCTVRWQHFSSSSMPPAFSQWPGILSSYRVRLFSDQRQSTWMLLDIPRVQEGSVSASLVDNIVNVTNRFIYFVVTACSELELGHIWLEDDEYVGARALVSPAHEDWVQIQGLHHTRQLIYTRWLIYTFCWICIKLWIDCGPVWPLFQWDVTGVLVTGRMPDLLSGGCGFESGLGLLCTPRSAQPSRPPRSVNEYQP